MVVIVCVCVCVLLRFRHRNIVDLLGFSDGGGSLCLIYSYMENRSLEDQLHNVTHTQMHTAQITPGFSQVFPGLGCFLGVIGGHCWVFSVLAFAIIAILLQYYRKKAGNTET